MNKRLENLSEEEIKFICKECDMTGEELEVCDENGLMEIYDIIFDIEMEEDMKDSPKMSKRAIMAANILSVLEE